MKKLFLTSFLIMSAMIGFAQGFYFDIGLGVGNAKTKINGQDMSDLFGSSVKEVGVDLGLKLGYGPISGTPLYIVGEISGIGHRFEDDYNYIQFNSYLIGPGLIIYPVPFIQLGTSIGYSFVSNQTDLPMEMNDSEGGTAANISIAFDFGKEKNGVLLGAKYAFTSNKLEISKAKQESSIFCIFVKYAYRHKN
ncbi:hypothetical protein [Gracilinema caldarium]|uniref:Outer membrane protein beta-barrel domain-containing protein n=1 Tax=Gracilinema caldarium (strain ATCC 51460 / DSM 7334 / H1) TaxID=744872 RepID=F8EZP0_GRAC1|nr:hypothetical protein [Gracilinema caldarium]AEJ20764.1 hypothetical protein Spica_2666 [Gracilinema caldarium DSM 7334]